MNEEDAVGRNIAKVLDQGLVNIDQNTLYRLQMARQIALDRLHRSEKIVHTGLGLSAHSGGHHWHFDLTKLFWLILFLLAFIWATILGKSYLENDEIAVIDTMILSDDLPLDVYVDDDFDKWLNSTH